MSLRQFNIRRNEIAICIFMFLLGIILSIVIFRNDIDELKAYAEVFGFQLKTIDISKERLFLYIFCNRMWQLVYVIALGLVIKNRYLCKVFFGFFFLLYGSYVSISVFALGIKGIACSVLLLLPQLSIYLFSYYFCLKKGVNLEKRKVHAKILFITMLIFMLLAGTIIESFVTMPFMIKIIL